MASAASVVQGEIWNFSQQLEDAVEAVPVDLAVAALAVLWLLISGDDAAAAFK